MFDYIIVGAGPSGLCAAKTILECEPDADLRLLDASESLGGVWTTSKLYPGLKTNNLRNGVDFTDLHMDDQFGIAEGQHVTGKAMNQYLQTYATQYDLHRRISCNVKVIEANHELDSTWKLRVFGLEVAEVRTKKLIIATGVTNEPHRPLLKGANDFNGPVFHSGEMGQWSNELITDKSIRSVCVLGGGKSAYDAVYLAANNGHTVEWVMRKSGKGPSWVFPATTKMGPKQAVRERLTLTRILTFFSPCFWQDGFSWIRNFLHLSYIGQLVTRKFWVKLGAATLEDCGYAKDSRLSLLEPETNPFFYGTSSGTLSYETDFFDLVRSGKVRLHREDISHLSSHTIHLADNTTLAADCLITATGFSAKPTFNFTPSTSHSDLGIPTTSLSKSQQSFWSNLTDASTSTIAHTFPRLLTSPRKDAYSSTPKMYNPGLDPEDARYTPWRLYRGIAPPGLTVQGDRSLVFVGMMSNIANTLRCELQCLWAYAYLNDSLPSLASLSGPSTRFSDDESEKTDAGTEKAMSAEEKGIWESTSLQARWAEVRAPFGHGRQFPDLVFDQMPYFDTLLRDLGLRFHRKGSLWRELFEPYGQDDYRGIVGEWLRTRDGMEKGKE